MTCTGLTDLAVLHVDSESDLLEEVVRLVTTWDPDMLVGYEVGYDTKAQHHVSFLSVLLLCALHFVCAFFVSPFALFIKDIMISGNEFVYVSFCVCVCACKFPS